MFWRIKRTNFIIVLAASLTVAFATSAKAAIINVPGDQPTIQAAINIALNGDEIIVAPGTYVETINFLGKAITVRSTDPDDPDVVQSTIINGNLAGSVVTCDSGEGRDSVLSGFVITGGSGTVVEFGFTRGGGMYNVNSSPTVTNCTFAGNAVDYQGGGMYNLDSSPNVINCSFVGNVLNGTYTFFFVAGGGMYNSGGSPIVTNCLFSANVVSARDDCTVDGVVGAVAVAESGGMHNYETNITVTDCTFTGNLVSASFQTESNGDVCGAGGGGVTNEGGSTTMINCTFTGNSAVVHSNCGDGASARGGGMANYSGNHTVTNCSFIENSISYAGMATAWGGGLFCGSNTTLTDTLFCGNLGYLQLFGGYTDGGGNEISLICPPVPPAPDPCPGDLDGDGTVNTSDLLALFANWGQCKK